VCLGCEDHLGGGGGGSETHLGCGGHFGVLGAQLRRHVPNTPHAPSRARGVCVWRRTQLQAAEGLGGFHGSVDIVC
jgi:hypothetical protein